jgi:hypothetical protein
MTQYRAVVGVDYPPNKRVEAGELVSDLPEKDVKWLLSSGFIEEVDGKGKTITPVVEEAVVEEEIIEPVIETVIEPVIEESPVVVEEGFDPDATDGDGDGFLQDGTVHQRPVEETK